MKVNITDKRITFSMTHLEALKFYEWFPALKGRDSYIAWDIKHNLMTVVGKMSRLIISRHVRNKTH